MNEKPSGTSWIDTIPATWNIERMKNQFVFSKGLNITKADLVDDGVAVISYGQIHAKNNTGTTLSPELLRYISPENIAITDKSLLHKGDIVFADTSEDYDGLGNAAYMDGDNETYAGYHTIIARPKNIDYSKYFAYLFKSDAWRVQLRVRASGIKVFSVTQRMLNDVTLIMPEKNAIKPIISFLDDRCSKVDAVIAEAKASIEEYKELKQAVIYEAVTKGLDKNVEMKDSGVEWIGKIPAHWTVKKIKRLGTARNGLTYSPNDMTDEIKGTLVIRSSNIQNGKWDYRDNVYVSCEIPDELMLKTGDIVICSRNGSRNLIGKNAMVDSNNIQTFGAFMMVYRSHIDNKEYIFWLLNSGMFKYYLPMFFTATINQLTRNNFNEMTVPFTPSKDEQDQIVQYIEKKVSIFDSLIAEKQSLMEDLESYKKSLIYEVVTGKRKVVE